MRDLHQCHPEERSDARRARALLLPSLTPYFGYGCPASIVNAR